MTDQHIVVCLKDSSDTHPATYTQATRRRFTRKDAMEYARIGIAQERDPRIVPVIPVELDDQDYPIKKS
jgi:hypothetical protein